VGIYVTDQDRALTLYTPPADGNEFGLGQSGSMPG
jgi:hypothetical protein